MQHNDKQTSKAMASKASKILSNPNSTAVEKSLAASALAQTGNNRETSKKMETLASSVMASKEYSKEAKSLAASVLAQANKAR